MFAPTCQLAGSQSSLLCVKFSCDGNYLVSAGLDKLLYLWDVYSGECSNIAAIKGHTNAILEVQWSTDSTKIFTASADKTVAVWDVEACKRLKKF